jgi:DNA uptake protein ComE-like DNA-binding protein
MKFLTAAACACALALLSGCQVAQQAQRETLEAEVKVRIAQAVQACHSQPFRTSVARAQCRNDAEAQARPFFPYPDLLDQRLAVRLALAERVDGKQLSEREAQRAFGQTMAHLLREDARRTASGPSGSVQQDEEVAQRSTSRRALEAGYNSPAVPAVAQPSAPGGQLVGVRVIQRTCVSDAAGNKTCRETEEPSVLQAPSAANTWPAASSLLQPSAAVVQHVAGEPVGLAASGPTRVDINTAPADDLNRLGGRFAKAIIRGRPYGSVDELVSKQVLTRSTFSQIKDQITAN